MPKTLDNFKTEFPEAWKAYAQLRDLCDKQGPLDRKTVELIKLGISVALEREGGATAHIAQAKKAGAENDEIYHAMLVATGLAGFPAVLAAFGAAKKHLEG